MLFLFAGNTLFADSARLPRRPLGATSPGSSRPGVLLACYVGLVGLAVASFTAARAFAIGGYVGADADPDASSAPRSSTAPALDKHLQLIVLGRLPIAAARALYRRRADLVRVAGWWWWLACGVVMAISAGCLWRRYRRADA